MYLPSGASPQFMNTHSPPVTSRFADPRQQIPQRYTVSQPNLNSGVASSSSSPTPNRIPQFLSSGSSDTYGNMHFNVAMGHGITLTKDEPVHIEDALNSLSACLEDYHGQYRDLEKLEDVVVVLEQVLRVSFLEILFHFQYSIHTEILAPFFCASLSSSLPVSIFKNGEVFPFYLS